MIPVLKHNTQKLFRHYSVWGVIGSIAGFVLSVIILLVFGKHMGWLPLTFGLISLPYAIDIQWHIGHMLRTVRGTATTPIGLSRSGYVELFGRAEPKGGVLIESPLSAQPCVWHRLEFNRGKHLWCEDSQSPFILRDASGECLIDVRGARVYGKVAERYSFWKPPPMHLEYVIRAGDPVYAIGELVHVNSEITPRVRGAAEIRYVDESIDTSNPMSRASAMRFADELANDGLFDSGSLEAASHGSETQPVDMLEHWQRDQKAFVKQFDANDDGRVDMKEMLTARRLAAEFEKAHAAASRQDAQHPEHPAHVKAQATVKMLRKPRKNGLPFLVMNRSIEDVERYLALHLWASHLFVVAAFGSLMGGILLYWKPVWLFG